MSETDTPQFRVDETVRAELGDRAADALEKAGRVATTDTVELDLVS